MQYKIPSICYSGIERKELNFILEPPKSCPYCDVAWQPEFIDSVYTMSDPALRRSEDIINYYLDGLYSVDVFWFCFNCQNTSISRYSGDFEDEIRLCYSFPKKAHRENFYSGIVEISPDFIKIYNEAADAECNSLLEVAGMGYRKALEFLVKDYAIKFNQSDKDAIEKMNISDCVNTYITHPDTAEIVKRTFWIANDQTHYVKLHTDMGLEDLKNLLELSINFITMDLRAKEALKITPKSKK